MLGGGICVSVLSVYLSIFVSDYWCISDTHLFRDRSPTLPPKNKTKKTKAYLEQALGPATGRGAAVQGQRALHNLYETHA